MWDKETIINNPNKYDKKILRDFTELSRENKAHMLKYLDANEEDRPAILNLFHRETKSLRRLGNSWLELPYAEELKKCLIRIYGEKQVLHKYGQKSLGMMDGTGGIEQAKVIMNHLFAQRRLWQIEYCASFIHYFYTIEKAEEIYQEPWHDLQRVLLASIFSNREDIGQSFDYIADLKKSIKALAHKKKCTHVLDSIEQFDPTQQVSTKQQMNDLNEIIEEPVILLTLAQQMLGKDDWLDKLCTIILAQTKAIDPRREINLNEVYYNGYTERIVTFIRKMTSNKERILHTQPPHIYSQFKLEKLDETYIIDYLNEYEDFAPYESFLRGNCDLSQVPVDVNRSRSLRNELETYRALFGENELFKRIKIVDSIQCYVEGAIDAAQLLHHNITPQQILTIFNRIHISGLKKEWITAYIKYGDHKLLEQWIQLLSAKEEVISELLKRYSGESVESKYIIITVLGKRLDLFEEVFLQLNEKREILRDAIERVYSTHIDLGNRLIEKLSSKKLSERKQAFEWLVRVYKHHFDTEITEVVNQEKNAPLKEAMLQHLSTTSQTIGDTDVQVIIKRLLVGKRKLKFLESYTLPDVLDQEGKNVSTEYMQACLIAYADEEVAGISKLGQSLTQQLNQASLEHFARVVYRVYIDEYAETKNKWVLYFSAIHGGIEVSSLLDAQIKEWAASGRSKMAIEATKALALNPSPQALLLVDAMSRKYKYKPIKKAAGEAILFAAEQLGVSKQELEDRIVPDLGFDQDRKQSFSYGTRSFDVYLGSRLELEVYDEKGKKLKNLPTVAKNDDQLIAQASSEVFKALKKQLKLVISTQCVRLEQAMIEGRRWTKQSYEVIFIKNPVMNTFAIGLIWGAYEKGELRETFRFMEDGTFNTIDEEEYTLQETMAIGLVHPIELDEQQKKLWKEQLEDYEIVQPIEQLERKVFVPTKEELNSTESKRFGGFLMSAQSFSNQCIEKGFERGEVLDAGIFYTFFKVHEPCAIVAEVNFSGINLAHYDVKREIVTHEIAFKKKENMNQYDYYAPQKYNLPIQEVDPKFYSEIMAQMTQVLEESKGIDEYWEMNR